MKHSLLQTFEKVLSLQFLDTLSDIRISVYASLLIKMLSILNPSILCLVLLFLL